MFKTLSKMICFGAASGGGGVVSPWSQAGDLVKLFFFVIDALDKGAVALILS